MNRRSFFGGLAASPLSLFALGQMREEKAKATTVVDFNGESVEILPDEMERIRQEFKSLCKGNCTHSRLMLPIKGIE